MISYKPLQKLLIDKGVRKGDLARKAGFSGSTMARLNTNKYVSLEVIDKICAVLGCQPGELMEYVADEEGIVTSHGSRGRGVGVPRSQPRNTPAGPIRPM